MGQRRRRRPTRTPVLVVARATRFESLIALFPAEWRGAVTVLSAAVRWIPEWQSLMLNSMLAQNTGVILLVAALLALPALLLVAGMWTTMVSLYTLPFRSGR